MKTKNVLIGIGALVVLGIAYDQMARKGILPKLFSKKDTTPVVPVTPPTAKVPLQSVLQNPAFTNSVAVSNRPAPTSNR